MFIFTGKGEKEEKEKKEEETIPEYSPGWEKITNSSLITRLLIQSQDQRNNLTIRLANNNAVYHSAIIDIDLKKNIILLDELAPRSGHEKLTTHSKIQIGYRCSGAEIRFLTTIKHIASHNGIALYHAQMPRNIHYLQRRQHFRVKTYGRPILHFRIPVTGQSDLRGQLSDISKGGVGVVISTPANLSSGQFLPSCRILLPQKKVIHSALDIRSFYRNVAYDTLRIGGMLSNINPREQETLERYIAKLERALIRRTDDG